MNLEEFNLVCGFGSRLECRTDLGSRSYGGIVA